MSPATAGRGFLLLTLALACFALSPTPKAFGVSPPPDGGYPNNNTAEGFDALLSLTSGSDNTAIGIDALERNTTGNFNTATVAGALLENTIGLDNTAIGFEALSSNTNGANNTATGSDALLNNTTGFDNTAAGTNALEKNRTGANNTANGFQALNSNTTGNFNTANGVEALFSNTTGFDNTANGVEALNNNTTGGNNTANGVQALNNNTTGGNNIALGHLAGQNLATGSNNIDIGNVGVVAETNTIRIGTEGTQAATFIAGIRRLIERTVFCNVDACVDATDELQPKKKKSRGSTTSRKDDMKKGYWVVAYRSISDESATKAYAELAVPAIQSFGGRFLARTSIQVHPHEAGLQQRTVIVEFDSYEIALATYESESYKKALRALGTGAERDFRIIEGV